MLENAYIQIPKGDTRTIQVKLTNTLGQAFDLTGYSVVFTAKAAVTDEDVNAIIGPKAGTVYNDTGGILHVNLTYAETNIAVQDLHFDIRIYKGSPSNPTNNYTVVRGKLNITENITDALI